MKKKHFVVITIGNCVQHNQSRERLVLAAVAALQFLSGHDSPVYDLICVPCLPAGLPRTPEYLTRFPRWHLRAGKPQELFMGFGATVL